LGFVEVNRLDPVSDECNRAVHLAVSIVLFREELSHFIATLPANSRGSVETEVVRFVDAALAFLEGLWSPRDGIGCFNESVRYRTFKPFGTGISVGR
jgi:hypothetical protein